MVKFDKRVYALIQSPINLKNGSTLKWRNTWGLEFTFLTHSCFSVALYKYIMHYKALVVSFSF